MFLVRHAKRGDVPTLAKLARMVYFINLPPDEKILNQKVEGSRDAFRRVAADQPHPHHAHGKRERRPEAGAGLAAAHRRSDVFVFVVEELETRSVVGTSQLISRMGGPGDPNYSLRLSERRFYSTTLNFGTTHTVARLYPDETGPTEVGGLILQPSLRGHAARPGRFISWVRFHFMGVYRSAFPDRVVAEMAPPVSPDGDNLFWDHIGRKFIPVKYAEADRFCQYNRKFIEELLPKDDIYLTLLPLEVLNHVAQVSAETIPARKVLERQGFKYKGFIDPFDGGPHIEADTDRIPLVADSSRVEFAGHAESGECDRFGIVSTMTDDGDFRAVETAFRLEGDQLRLPKQAADALHPSGAEVIGVTPYPDVAPPRAPEPPAPKLAPRVFKASKAKSKKRRGGPAGSDGV